jgi:lipopolysaccharide biosynthesis protein
MVGWGFTEWTNVAKKFQTVILRGRYQPRVPADLGHYDLKIPEIIESAINAYSKDAGIEGFIFWHYWFGMVKTIEYLFREY